MFERFSRTLNQWKKGVRLYIALTTLLITLQTWWWASVNYSGTNLFATRLEEIYAWLALGLICLAVSIGPTFKLFPRAPGKKLLFDARRLIGVSGAWFASLHVLISYSSLFKFANPLSLPLQYQKAFALGAFAWIVLLAMAFTSFDRAFNRMGIWWFRLHRFVYLALLLILAHAFIIGAHATQRTVLLVLTIVAALLIGLHVFILKRRPTKWQLLALLGTAVLLFIIFNYGYGQSTIATTMKGNYTQ